MSNRSRHAVAAIAWACVAFAAPSLAHAQTTPLEEAKTQFNLGAQAYSTARYDVAVAAFSEAYKLLPRAEILFSLAQAEKKQCVVMKDGALLKRALVHYRQYYREVETGGRKTEAAEAIGYLEQLATQPDFGGAQAGAPAQKSQTKLSVYSSVDGAHVYIDGRSQGDVPFVGAVTPGKHRVLVRLEGFVPSEREIVIAEGTTQTLPINLVERPVGVAFDTPAGTDVYVDGGFVGRAPFPVEGVALAPGAHMVVAVKNGKRLLTKEVTVERSKPVVVRLPLETSTQRAVAFVTGGVGVATLVAAGAFYGVALAEQSRAQNRQLMLNNGNLQPQGLAQYNAAAANRDAFRAAGTVTALAGLGALAAGVALYAFDRPDPNSVPLRAPEGPKTKPRSDFDVAAVPLFTDGTYGVGAIGRF